MPTVLRMPEIAANATEAVLAEWSVDERADFTAQQPLATVETEKAMVDVEAEGAGVLLKQLVPPGSQVEVGAPIAILGAPGEQVDDLDAVLADLGVVPGAAPTAPQRRLVPGDPEGDPEGGTADTSGAAPSVSATPGETHDVNGTSVHTGGRIFASPLARKLAAEAGLAIAEIDGTGPHQRVTRRDVQAAISARDEAAVTTAGEPNGETAAAYRDVEHTPMRRAIARRLCESKQQVPHFYVRGTARVDRLLALRTELNADAELSVSVNDLILKASALATRRVPRMNVTWTEGALRHHESVDIALAVATDDGLLTPVLRGVDRLSISTLAARTRELADRARARRLREDDLVGGALSVSNLGMYGTEEFAAIINPPQAAILAVGAARRAVVAGDEGPECAMVLTVTVSADHRAVDGAHVAEWLREFVGLIESPIRLLA